MSQNESDVDSINSFLLKYSGITGEELKNIMLSDDPDPSGQSFVQSSGPTFFKPYQSISDPFFRAASIVTAPLCLSVLAVEFAMASVILAFKALIDLPREGFAKAKETIKMSASCLMLMTFSLFAVFASPFINAIDLIGGGITTVVRKCTDEEFEDPSYKF